MNNPKKAFVVLLVVFLTPVLLSWAYFYYVENFSGGNLINYGKLITPPVTTNNQSFVLTDIKDIDNNKILPKKWTLTLLNFAETCGQKCQDNLKTIVRIKALQGEDIRRIQTLLVTNIKDQNLRQIVAKHQNLLLLNKDLNLFKNFISNTWQQQTNTIVLLDPLGNIMMQYPINNIDIKKVLKDFKRLLKYSRIG